MKYNHKEIESKWAEIWEKTGLNRADLDKAKKPFYNLMMFPYPSAEGLHVGNMYAFVHSDAYGRFMKSRGFDVFEPIGLDGFGIHSENYAIKIKEHIKTVSQRTEKHFYEQLHMIGNQYDWSRTVETYKPEYYKWTQWLFLQMYKKGLAYRAQAPVNWCPSCKTVLSDEQVINGQCERCSSETEKRQMEQWFFKITDYAERLLKNLEWIDWSEPVKIGQRNWIGKSEGAIVKFKIVTNTTPAPGHPSSAEEGKGEVLEVFTTRPDTLFGATFMVICPEHQLIKKLADKIENYEEIKEYQKKAGQKSDLERTDLNKDKTGIELKGVKAINPANHKEIPIFVADYVLVGYGTGAIMAVPAHDERDWEFAKKYGLEIIEVVGGGKNIEEEAYAGSGKSVNSEFLNGLGTKEATAKMIEWLTEKKIGRAAVNYKLRDWCVSRQRYWGPPIPMVYCDNCAKKKQKVLIIHGFEGNTDDGFKPWIKKELEKNGFEVFAPNISTSYHPTIESWLKELKPFIDRMDENDIIVGHSLGGKMALHLIEKANKKIKALFLVAAVVGDLGEKKWREFKKIWPNSDVDALRSCSVAPIDFDEITQKSENIFAFLSDDDPFIPIETHNNLPKSWRVEVINNRQHFEGEFFPELLDRILSQKMISGIYPVPEKDLPVLLPEMENFLPDGSGKGPLNKVKEFVKTTCPKCGAPARRETDVSDPFVDSSWYFLRYPCADFDDRPFDKERLAKWLPVDMYIGGKEHTVLHLLYSRFVAMVMHDLGYLKEEEPFKRFFAHGLLIKEGAKMSKSKGNIINPDEYIEKFGADSVRMYLMFLGDVRVGGDWRDAGMAGMHRFINRVWSIAQMILEQGNKKTIDQDVLKAAHKTIKRIGDELEKLKFNTAIAAIMEGINSLYEFEAAGKKIGSDVVGILAQVIAPFAPFMAEEIWSQLGYSKSIFTEKWPEYDAELIKDETISLPVQINGRVRAVLPVSADITEDDAKKLALADATVQKWLEGKEPKKVIFIKGRLVNIVV